MKNFQEYLAESQRTYNYRVKIVGDVEPAFVKALEEKLKQFDPVKVSAVKKTPIQAKPADFPAHSNDSVTSMDVEFRRELLRCGMAFAEGDESHHALTFDLIGTPHDCRFGYRRMSNQGAFDFGRSESVTGDIQHIIDTTDDPEIAVFVPAGAVAREVGSFDFAPILFFVARLVSVDCPEHGWPRLADNKLSAFPVRHFLAVVVNDCRINAKERKRGRAWFEWRGTWQW
jgi:hypothetical protein